MIKEMGDGFLCSVGFPFNSQGSLVDNAYALAEMFVEIFQNQVERYFDCPHYCGIGISLGEVTGYFPTIGLKQYDLYGDAIVHATRYEGMRKHLFQSGVEKGNIIIIQEKAYQMLSLDLAEGLIKYKLDDCKVRDDGEATCLYYKIVSAGSGVLGSAS